MNDAQSVHWAILFLRDQPGLPPEAAQAAAHLSATHHLATADAERYRLCVGMGAIDSARFGVPPYEPHEDFPAWVDRLDDAIDDAIATIGPPP